MSSMCRTLSALAKAFAALAITALFAFSASGQTPPTPATERTFRLVGGESPQAIKEIAYAVGVTTALPKLPVR